MHGMESKVFSHSSHSDFGEATRYLILCGNQHDFQFVILFLCFSGDENPGNLIVFWWYRFLNLFCIGLLLPVCVSTGGTVI